LLGFLDLGLGLVGLRLGSGLGGLSLSLALVLLGLALLLEGVVVGDVTNGLLDLALDLFKRTHLVPPWLRWGTSCCSALGAGGGLGLLAAVLAFKTKNE